MSDKKNSFKAGDKVICIAKPEQGSYQCDIGAKATVRKAEGRIIYTEEQICTSSTSAYTCYRHQHFALQKKPISFKILKE